jgi:hypothetical protein
VEVKAFAYYALPVPSPYPWHIALLAVADILPGNGAMVEHILAQMALQSMAGAVLQSLALLRADGADVMFEAE